MDNRERAYRCLTTLSRSRLPWVLSTHREEDIPRSATHLCRLQRGSIVELRLLTSRARRSVRISGKPAKAPRRARGRLAKAIVDAAELLKLQQASVWREGNRVLRSVTLTIRRGDCWVVHGSNGSGKSSLLQLLYGDLGAAHGGLVWRDGIESGVSLDVFKRRVGLIAPELQASHPRYLPVEEVVSSGLYSSIGVDPIRPLLQQRRIHRVLRQTGAADLQHRLVRSLSYGQLRRVLFARALIHNPEMLLLDEPYAGIDARTRDSLIALVQRQSAAGVTVVMATHHRQEWPATVSHELELERSQVVYCGPVRA
jgi:molybdate transport system ATP-binding protein